MWRARPSGRRKHGRYFGDRPAGKRRLDDHLACEFHAWSMKTQTQRRGAVDTTKTAVKVAHPGGEEQPPREAQQWIAEIPMQEWHGAGSDAAAKTMADDHQVPLAQSFDECIEPRKIVAVIGVTHNDVAPMGCVDAANECVSIAFACYL